MRSGSSSLTRKRVLIVSNLFPPHVIGGAEVVAYRQARALQTRGYTVSVLAGWEAPSYLAGSLEFEEQDGLRVWRVPVFSFAPDDNFYIPSIESRFKSVLEAELPEIVHFHNLIGLGFSLLPVVKRRGLPAIATLHDYSGYCYRATALRPDGTACQMPEECGVACTGSIRPRHLGVALPLRLRRDYVAWALAQADRLISPSAALAAAFRSAGVADPTRIAVISNGIDLTPFQTMARRQGADVLRFACIAYLGEHKGIPDLLEAAAQLTAQPDLTGRWSLTIAGDGHLRPQVESEIASGRLGNAVTYIGRVTREHVIARLAATDVIVLPSRWPENEPVVLLEAIAAGVAQLATATGGMTDLVEQGVTGELIPPANPDALAATMAAYIRDPARARRYGEANLARRDSFSERTTVEAIERAYNAVSFSPSSSGSSRPLVLCTGDRPQEQVAEICNNLYRLEEPLPGIRLVWHSWVDPEAWSQATLLWNWSHDANYAAMRRALRAGVPILAPKSCLVASGIESSFGAALTYDTFLEGMLALARVPHNAAALNALRRNCQEAASFLASTAPQDHYRLQAPDLVV